ncbi:MAG: endonuclease III [Chlamydiales bacterium]|nr:endonuclease III [Chlamydiales bacterium]
MNRKERAHIVRKHLEALFPNPPIPLNHKDPFTLLIAVILSAQCTDERVNKVTPSLFEKASTPEQMLNLSQEQLQNLIQTCGLAPTKSKNILKLCAILVDEYKSCVPQSIEELEKLPGVGRKTASVVAAQAFGIPAIGVDTHILRLTKRWGLSQSKTPLQTERDLQKLYPKSIWKTIHLQMIYYGRRYCPARNHTIENCPICHELDTVV